MKYLKIAVITLFAFAISSCNDDDDTSPFDHAGQYVIEKPILEAYLATHYYDEEEDEIKDIEEGSNASPLSDIMKKTEVVVNDVEQTYELYTYIINKGEVGEELVIDDEKSYRVNTIFSVKSFEQGLLFQTQVKNNVRSFNIDNFPLGFLYGVVGLKGGFAIEDKVEEPRTYEEGTTGRALIVMPSGLAQRNAEFNDISGSENKPLIYNITINAVFQQ